MIEKETLILFFGIGFAISVLFFRYLIKHHYGITEASVMAWAMTGQVGKVLSFVFVGIIALPAMIVFLPIDKILERLKKK